MLLLLLSGHTCSVNWGPKHTWGMACVYKFSVDNSVPSTQCQHRANKFPGHCFLWRLIGGRHETHGLWCDIMRLRSNRNSQESSNFFLSIFTQPDKQTGSSPHHIQCKSPRWLLCLFSFEFFLSFCLDLHSEALVFFHGTYLTEYQSQTELRRPW